jgi:2-polyprenyl-3-methyl-5-hydroxy-6-metoxy-1,4-benzoquinol methylase
MNNIINNIYHNKLAESLLHTVVFELKNELRDCKSVLDLGCGPDSPVQYCENIKYKVGVETYTPYLVQSKSKGIHNEYINKRIEDLDFEPKSYDAVVMVEVIEHLTKEEGLRILEKAEKWARKKVIITTPNGFIHQNNLDDNKLQEHLSGWLPEDFKKRGYRVRGLAGLKYLRKEADHKSMDDSITSTIRWKPKNLWFGISAASQIFCYYLPDLAFELIATWRPEEN